jgi:hypothetical protein
MLSKVNQVPLFCCSGFWTLRTTASQFLLFWGFGWLVCGIS